MKADTSKEESFINSNIRGGYIETKTKTWGKKNFEMIISLFAFSVLCPVWGIRAFANPITVHTAQK